MSFNSSLYQDIHVFINTSEHGEKTDIEFGGTRYNDVSVVITEVSDEVRSKAMFGTITTNDEGLSKLNRRIVVDIKDIGGREPKIDSRFRFGTGKFLPCYIVKNVSVQYDIAQITLEKVDE